MPKLELLATMRADLEPPLDVGSGPNGSVRSSTNPEAVSGAPGSWVAWLNSVVAIGERWIS
jgi:hypothetical protein